MKRDVREDCGRTYYLSAGSTQEYQDFAWIIDSKGALMAADGSGACMAAHRTYISDCHGRENTFLISTRYHGHENKWYLDRVGDMDR